MYLVLYNILLYVILSFILPISAAVVQYNNRPTKTFDIILRGELRPVRPTFIEKKPTLYYYNLEPTILDFDTLFLNFGRTIKVRTLQLYDL